ncbi:Uncharacterized protein APZ42_031228 [Daphnia magna]|uniref:Uncharacterized protein n=1 Tax=Daphnia magna TaxID=35525 RepID=A0A164N163_9CRUS|nr:Uncharacterized protein APZ42_031228 [Daphnia magna]
MESSDECHALLRVACLPLNDYGSQRTLTTTGHCNLVVLDESGGGCCESADVIIVQHEMTSTTTEPTHTVGRKSSDQRTLDRLAPAIRHTLPLALYLNRPIISARISGTIRQWPLHPTSNSGKNSK